MFFILSLNFTGILRNITLRQHYVGNDQLKQINDLILRDWLRKYI